MIQIKNLTKIYGQNSVLDNINLTFKTNKIYSVIGRNGAGKTTLVNIITNRAFATNGVVTIENSCGFENDEVQEKIFCITEKSAYPTIEKVKDLFKWASRFYPNFDMEYANYLAQRFEIEIDKRLGKLSTGYTTIAKVILTLASNVQYMIFDEPVLGIDTIYREIFYEELQKTQQKLKNTMIICSHILDEMESIIDHVIILRKGQVAFDGPIEEITKAQTLQEFYLKLHKKSDIVKIPETQIKKQKPKSHGKMDIKKIKNSFHYLFNISWLHACIILTLIVLFTTLPLFIQDINFSIEITLIINLFIIAMSLHGYFFKYALYNGVSRRTYFTSVITIILVYAVFFSFLTSISISIIYLNVNTKGLIGTLYPSLFEPFNFISFLALFGWLFFVNTFFMAFALFSMVLFQTLTRKGRYIAMTILTAFVLGLMLWGTFSLNSLVSIFLFILGLKYNLGAWFAVAWFIIFGLTVKILSWLILKRTEIK